jgi:hypothetical protein
MSQPTKKKNNSDSKDNVRCCCCGCDNATETVHDFRENREDPICVKCYELEVCGCCGGWGNTPCRDCRMEFND